MHSTSNLKDGYLGSGKRLRYSIRKYGESNFKLEILEFFSTREELVKREKELVNEDLIKDSNCLNLKLGGNGGLHKMTPEEEFLWHSKGGKQTFILYGKQRAENTSKRNKELWKKGVYSNFKCDWTGKKHKPETIQKMKEVAKGKGLGVKNSQHGTIWVTNGIESKKIKKESTIPEGFYIGRKIKKL